MSEKYIHIKGARVNNLKNIEVKIQHNKLTVITGLSGSGKSSLAFNTLYAEGQRRYVESLSSYARQFLGRFDKPDTDFIKGISPAIAIEQKVISSNPRSTIGTTTEIYDYLRVLFARIGTTYSPISGDKVTKHTVYDVIEYIKKLPVKTKILVTSPIINHNIIDDKKQLTLLQAQGFSRLLLNNEIYTIEEIIESEKSILGAKLIIDRIQSSQNEDELVRISDSISLAFYEGKGVCELIDLQDKKLIQFTNKFELDGIEFAEPSEQFFTFNNPYGACKTCEGYGSVISISPELIFPDKSLSVYQGAIACWRSDSMRTYLDELLHSASKFNFPIHRPIHELTETEKELLWSGNKYFTGLSPFFKFIESQTYKIQYRVMLSRYRGKTTCQDCKGSRLRSDTNHVKINGKSITDIVLLPINQAKLFFEKLNLPDHHQKIADRILFEVISRLDFLCKVGLPYLTLNRTSNTLSGGESQRINLATSLGSSLVGSMYILDEPSIGLHPRDTKQLITVLLELRDIGNTVIVVEHEEEIMRAADEIIDIGPMAGIHGGEVVFQGTDSDLRNQKNSLTAQYLTQEKVIEIPKTKRKQYAWIHLNKVSEHNINELTISLPLNNLVCITGVSGSGKSTLIKHIVLPYLRSYLGEGGKEIATESTLTGDIKTIKSIEFIDQNPIGKSSRSNPVTYVKAFDDIRELFASQPASKANGYKAGFFSFNVEGGRCEMCQGEGQITIQMQFMADVHITCDTCHGKRYKPETLAISYNKKSIADVLSMNISEALRFFGEKNGKTEAKICTKIQPLEDVGLGYLTLGQASSTMSGGEAQRIKLASFLSKGSSSNNTLFVFDEPTTGLHFYDIEKLLIAFQKLIDSGNSIFVIEHNVEVIKCADWVIDLGPEGGDNGGKIMFSGTPENLIQEINNYTGFYLKDKFKC
jgi:excinuclease ABC subunit A